jgi:hypothetical protein
MRSTIIYVHSRNIDRTLKIKACRMGIACSRHAVVQNTCTLLFENQKSINHLGYSEMDVSLLESGLYLTNWG